MKTQPAQKRPVIRLRAKSQPLPLQRRLNEMIDRPFDHATLLHVRNADRLQGTKCPVARSIIRNRTSSHHQDAEEAEELAKAAAGGAETTVTVGQLTGDPQELKNDDGKPAGKKSFPRGIASAFKVPGDGYHLISVRIHGSRYGYPRPPEEDFHVSLCDNEFNLISDFSFPYSKFKRGKQDWVSLRVKPTAVPKEFVICLNFNPERTKGVYVSHDGEGRSLVGLPGKPAGAFTGGDWMIRPRVDTIKPK